MSRVAPQHDAVWMGKSKVQAEMKAGQIDPTGDTKLASSMQRWLGLASIGVV
jgi:hypothetical protein